MEFFTSLHQLSDWGLVALRIGVGAIFFAHGRMKWAMWKMQPSEQMPASMISLMRLLSVVEPLGAIAVLSGFLTQLAAVGLGIIMVGAINLKVKMMKVKFMGQEKAGWEFDLIILCACIALLLFGGGALSLDRIFFGV